VQAWEPQEALVALIETSLALNGLSAETMAAAAGRAVGRACLKVPGQFMGSAALGTEGTSVIVGRLDRHTKGQVDFVKIDAEGSEHAVWDGMTGLLEHPSITVLMEFAPVICESPATLLEKIEGAGFPLRWLTPDGPLAALSRAEALEGEWKMLWLQRQS
jgi:FkbM family methyltransferase